MTEYEAAAGVHAAWVYFSDNWFNPAKRTFPAELAEDIADHDSVPFIRLMLRDKQDPVRDSGPYPLRPGSGADPAFDALLADPRIRGFSWWNETWENGGGCDPTEMRVQESAGLQGVFTDHLVGNDDIVQFPLAP